jgi:CheY-like chemotaxis protein
VVQQERLRALGQMASGVAHDVNNALAPVVAYADIILMELPDLPDKFKNYLKIIKQGGEDIAKIVARMREFYRRRSDAEPLVLVDLNRLVQEVTELTRPRWRDISQRQGISIQVQHELEPQLPLFPSDPSELREALTNLVFNAVDALPRGGVITLVTRSTKVASAEPDGTSERRIQVAVRDNGTGMDEKTRQRCLEPFFTTKTLRGGTGLGLAMVYGMVQRHDGGIEIESSPGHGTCVRLTFPIQRKVLQAVPNGLSSIKKDRSLYILCIDDEEANRQLLTDSLTHFSHRVVTASSGDQGIELFRAARLKNQPFEAVITDLGMPKMDGHQLARTIKAESPSTPIIMMTGWGSMMTEDGETAPEVDALVGKPPQIRELNELLLRLVRPPQLGIDKILKTAAHG